MQNWNIAQARVEDHLEQIESFHWFSNIGNLYVRPRVSIVSRWDECIEWTRNPISHWCDLEAKNTIYRSVRDANRQIFVGWNDVAKIIFPKIVQSMENIRKFMPVGSPQCVDDWIQCQIVGSCIELYYSDFVASKMFYEQVEIFRDGHCPCGWHIESQNDFPKNAILMVY